LPDFKISLETAVLIHWNHLAEEIYPDAILGRVSLPSVKTDDQTIVLVRSVDQWNARRRILRDTRIYDRVVDLYGE
ncbi:MAG TPA: hypothetical protein VFY40_10845, partial [Blastocatellia bacterium]|nr:hypothetical protein [Blastocatellia bacterium]